MLFHHSKYNLKFTKYKQNSIYQGAYLVNISNLCVIVNLVYELLFMFQLLLLLLLLLLCDIPSITTRYQFPFMDYLQLISIVR